MTRLEHEARRKYAIIADFQDPYFGRVENVAADLLEKWCPIGETCDDFSGDCLKCWLKEYNPEECSDEV